MTTREEIEETLYYVNNWVNMNNPYPCEYPVNITLNVTTSMDVIETIRTCLQEKIDSVVANNASTDPDYKALYEEQNKELEKLTAYKEHLMGSHFTTFKGEMLDNWRTRYDKAKSDAERYKAVASEMYEALKVAYIYQVGKTCVEQAIAKYEALSQPIKREGCEFVGECSKGTKLAVFGDEVIVADPERGAFRVVDGKLEKIEFKDMETGFEVTQKFKGE